MMKVSSHNAHTQTRDPFFVTTPLRVADCRLCFEQHTSHTHTHTRRNGPNTVYTVGNNHSHAHTQHKGWPHTCTACPLVRDLGMCTTPPTASDTNARKLQSATFFPPINFRIRTSIPTWSEPLIAPYTSSSVLPLSQESPSAPQERRQHRRPCRFSNSTAPGLQSLQGHGPAALSLSEADSVAGLFKSKRCLRIWRVRCRVAIYANIAIKLLISP